METEKYIIEIKGEIWERGCERSLQRVVNTEAQRRKK